MRKHSTERVCAKAIQRSYSENKNTLGLVVRTFAESTFFINRKLGPWSDAYFIDRSSLDGLRHVTGKVPERWRFFSLQSSTGIFLLNFQEQRPHHFVDS